MSSPSSKYSGQTPRSTSSPFPTCYMNGMKPHPTIKSPHVEIMASFAGQDYLFSVHKLLLHRSRYFTRRLEEFGSTTWKPIILECDPWMVETYIDFLYRGAFSDSQASPEYTSLGFDDLADLYRVAFKFEDFELQKFAMARMSVWDGKEDRCPPFPSIQRLFDSTGKNSAAMRYIVHLIADKGTSFWMNQLAAYPCCKEVSRAVMEELFRRRDDPDFEKGEAIANDFTKYLMDEQKQKYEMENRDIRKRQRMVE
ncbi:hypothetical protein K505DRAFT_400386 [Melanomma pulvis-pyrius CBS 109.77]|uniref:BTB domain-containing protein n=1 Tax=Melanomma pulvis-pyrius CBS 109.77 TaxID=1314802 RepID=A0A6A6XJS8_9PLEO|nr:hypothetical protein K505DRAFT_400386 [Melanomma pulvis-pyrius CBS 109.77]